MGFVLNRLATGEDLAGLVRHDVMLVLNDFDLLAMKRWRKIEGLMTPYEFRQAGGKLAHMPDYVIPWRHLRPKLSEKISEPSDCLQANLLSEIASWGVDELTPDILESLDRPTKHLYSVSWIMTEKEPRTEEDVRHMARVRTDEEIRTEFGQETLDELFEQAMFKGYIDEASPIHRANFSRRVQLAEARFVYAGTGSMQHDHRDIMELRLKHHAEMLRAIGQTPPWELPKPRPLYGKLWLPHQGLRLASLPRRLLKGRPYRLRDNPFFSAMLGESAASSREIRQEFQNDWTPPPAGIEHIRGVRTNITMFDEAMYVDEDMLDSVRSAIRISGLFYRGQPGRPDRSAHV